jgi:SAM-dependent methyltransferase
VIGKAGKGDVPIDIPGDPYVIECKNCDLLYINPMPYWTRDDFNKLYDNSYFVDKVEHNKQWLDIRANKNVAYRFRRIEKYLSTNNKKMLEAGAGIFAFMCVYLASKGWDVTAQEPSPDICESLSEQHPNLQTTSAAFLELNEVEKFSLIYADSVFEHVPDPLNYIKKSSRLLENGGILYFISPNEKSFKQWGETLISKLKNAPVKYLTPYKEPYHLIGFSKKSMEIAAKESGLTLIKYYKKDDYYWFLALKSNKKLVVKYLAAIVLYVMDRIGWGGNLEIMFKKD